MFFGELPVAGALGAVLAHTTRAGDAWLTKGKVLEQADIDRLTAAGITQIMAARLDEDDVPNDAAAMELAKAIVGRNIALGRAGGGRVNLSAERDGLFTLRRDVIEAINGVDEGITLATLAGDTRVPAGRMLATIRIIPLAMPRERLDMALGIARGSHGISLDAFEPKKAFLLQTTLTDTNQALLDKTFTVTDDRLALRNAAMIAEMRIEHDVTALAAALSTAAADDAVYSPDWILVSCAAAISDRCDVLPSAIEKAGGTVLRYGIPMDPGNVLLIGELRGKPVLGLPGCAHSPADNGFDRVLDRIAAGLEPDDAWLASLAPGGLLPEIPDRPQPRRHPGRLENPRIGMLLLAAGHGTRFGPDNKLLAEVDTLPVIAHAAARIAESGAERLLTVTARESDRVEAAIAQGIEQAGVDIELRYANNPTSDRGIASSLVIGVSRLSANDAIIACLGDMPAVKASTMQQLRDCFQANPGAAMIIPCHHGQRGNPVLISRSLFDTALDLDGDAEVRQLIASSPESTIRLEVEDEGILLDCNTLADLEQLEAYLAEV